MKDRWYPAKREEMNKALGEFLSQEFKAKSNGEVHGLIVPHAGYAYSGAIAGKAYSLLKQTKIKKAVILGPSHYAGFYGVKAIEKASTPLGSITIPKNKFLKFEGFEETPVEHSVNNQIPFLQKLGIKEILPLVTGNITAKDAGEIAEYLAKEFSDYVFIFSTDLSHFLPYDEAVKADKKTIGIIEKLDLGNFENVDACGKFALMIMGHLCKLRGWKPKLIEYKNSGDITGDKSSVVGYASFWF